MKVLLVGGAGRVGTAISPYLAERHDLRVLDVVRPCGDIEWIQGSISNPDDVARALEGMYAFVNLVMRYPQGGTLTDQDVPTIVANYEVNTLGLHLLLWTAQGQGIRRGVHTSSMSVHFRKRNWYPSEETVRLDSPSVYGLTKGLGELICEYFAQWFGMSIIALRISAPAGRSEYVAERRNPSSPGFYVTDEEDLARAYLFAIDVAPNEHGRFDAVYVVGDEGSRPGSAGKALTT